MRPATYSNLKWVLLELTKMPLIYSLREISPSMDKGAIVDTIFCERTEESIHHTAPRCAPSHVAWKTYIDWLPRQSNAAEAAMLPKSSGMRV